MTRYTVTISADSVEQLRQRMLAEAEKLGFGVPDSRPSLDDPPDQVLQAALRRTGTLVGKGKSVGETEPGDDGWIRHDGTDQRPVHAMDMVETIGISEHEKEPTVDPAHSITWRNVDLYRPLRDEHGIPYCSAEGLEDWAEYVATDPDERAWQYDCKPLPAKDEWYSAGHGHPADGYANTREHWTDTRRRIWRPA